MKRFACFTMDLERDYGQDHIDSRWMVDEFLLREDPLFNSIFKPLDIPITAFTVAKLIEETPEIIDSLKNAGTDIQLHSYNHDLSRKETHRIPSPPRYAETIRDRNHLQPRLQI